MCPVTAPETSIPAPARRFGWRDGARWFGIACLLAAAFLGGYVSWLLWGTGITTQRAQNELRPQIEQQIANPPQSPARRSCRARRTR